MSGLIERRRFDRVMAYYLIHLMPYLDAPGVWETALGGGNQYVGSAYAPRADTISWRTN